MKFFKNAIVYSITDESLRLHSAMLEGGKFREIDSSSESSIGLVSPLDNGLLVHELDGRVFIKLRIDKKVIPGSAVKSLLKERIKEIEEKEQRKVPSKEKKALKEEVISSMLSRAFVSTSFVSAYFDYHNNTIVVDASGHSKAELLLSHLRKTLGSLPVAPLMPSANIPFVFNGWLLASFPDGIKQNGKAELEDSDGGKIKYKDVDLSLPQVVEHIKSGCLTNNMSLEWQEKMACVVSKDFTFKAIKITNIESDVEPETWQEQFDIDFVIFAATFAEMLDCYINQFSNNV